MSTSGTANGAAAALQGSIASNNSAALEDFSFPPDHVPIQDRKDEALAVLKSDVLAELDKGVKSLDEDNWMFEGPRSRINLISRPGINSFSTKDNQTSKATRLSLIKMNAFDL